MEEFEKIVGLEYLKGVHVNDSKTKRYFIIYYWFIKKESYYKRYYFI